MSGAVLRREGYTGIWLGLLLAVALASALVSGRQPLIGPSAPTGSGVEASIAKLPLSFEPNAGRADGSVDFLANSVAGGTLYLTSRTAVLSFPDRNNRSRALTLGLAGGNPEAASGGLAELPGKANSFIGDDPSKWRSGIPTYSRVRYQGVYPGVDLDWCGNQRRLEYDFRLAPHADPGRIALDLGGAESVRIGAHGDLAIAIGGREIRQAAPVAYQTIAGERRTVKAGYTLEGSRVSFNLGPYDHSRALIIDPLVLAYSTYLGSGSGDSTSAVAVDSTGAAYVVGDTDSTSGFPLQDPIAGQVGDPDGNVYVAKFNPDSGGPATLAYSTYLGGSIGDFGFAIAVDSAGAAYVTGETFSTNFPTQDQFQANQAGPDAFVTRLNPDSGGAVTLAYSTYLGGTNAAGFEGARGIAVDSAGAAYLAGFTDSDDFPTQDEFMSDPGDVQGDAFATKLKPDSGGAVTLAYSTYLGGDANDEGLGIGVDPTGAAYLGGQSGSTDYPTQDPFQANSGGGNDSVVTKINPDSGGATTLAYSTYLGGSSSDQLNGIAVDSGGAAYVTGFTQSTNYPTQDNVPGQIADATGNVFVTRLQPDSGGPATLAYSTYLGASGSLDWGTGIAVDPSGSAYVTGYTDSTGFPVQDPFQGNQPGRDAFVSKLAPDSGGAAALNYSTYLGGGGSDNGTGIAVDTAGAAYVVGYTTSSGATAFPTQDPFQPSNQGGNDGFVAKVLPTANAQPPAQGTTPAPSSKKCKKGRKLVKRKGRRKCVRKKRKKRKKK